QEWVRERVFVKILRALAELRRMGIDMIAPHHPTHTTKTQDGRKLRRYKRRWLIERFFSWLMKWRRLRRNLWCQRKNSLATSCAISRSRFFEKVLWSKLGSSMFMSRNQRNRML